MSLLIVSLLVGMLVCYSVCGIPFGLLIARAKGIDVRSVGSGNIGTTNVGRAVGASAAGETLACDALKGFFSMMVCRELVAALCFGGDFSMTRPQTSFGWITTLLYLACICGHVFSPYLRFHGGKGIAVGFGAGLGLAWPLALGLLAVFIAFAVPSRYVSAGSVAADISVPIWGLVLGFTPASIPPLIVVTCVVVWAHRENITKLLHGREQKFSFHHDGSRGQGPTDKKSGTGSGGGALS
jgi:glycerol-3-phosphate acyltransferase PlsY